MPPLPRGIKAKPASAAQEKEKPQVRRVGSLGNVGRQIMSQDSQKSLKKTVPKATELNKIASRQDKNYIKANLDKVVYEPAYSNHPKQGQEDVP